MTTTFRPGDRVVTRVAGIHGTVSEVVPDHEYDLRVMLDRDIKPLYFRSSEVTPAPAVEAVPAPVSAAGTTDPAHVDLADLGERPPLVVVGTDPVTMVRTPPHGIPLRDASRLGAAVFSPSQVAADRKVLADAGFLDILDAALGKSRRDVEDAADRPALAAYDDGHAQGHRDGLLAALRIVQRFEDVAVQTNPAYAALLGNVRDAITAEVRS